LYKRRILKKRWGTSARDESSSMQTDQWHKTPSFQTESRSAGRSFRVTDIFPSSPSVDELATLPLEVRKMVRTTAGRKRNVRLEEWQDYSFLLSNPLERIRWWLLYPKRIEFLLWASGTFLLVCATIVFVFVITLSMNTASQGGPSAGEKPAATTSVIAMPPPLSSSAKIPTPAATLPATPTAGQESDTHVTDLTLGQLSLSLNSWQWSLAAAGYGLSLLFLGLAFLLHRARRK